VERKAGDIGPRSPVFREIVRPVYRGARFVASRAIDRLCGVRTVERTPHESMLLPERGLNETWGWVSLIRLFHRHPLGPTDAFVDVGSGAGRVALAASWLFRCRRVIAIERDPRLHDAAVRNLQTCRPSLRTPVELMNGDALTWALPPEVSVIFLYNPFSGQQFRELVGRVLESLDRSPRRLRLLYANPVEAEFLAGIARFELIDVLRAWRPRSDWARTTSVNVYGVT
jgi:SAM-dependent methyltransferase